jgi:hypothetical protein
VRDELKVPDGVSEAPPDLWALCDLQTPWCLFTVATLRIADHMSADLTEIGDLARAAECDAGLLNRVLAHLSRKGVFEQVEPGRYALNQAARGLLEPALRIGLDLNGIGGRMAYAWGTMPTFVRTGQPAYREVFGMPFWEDLDAHPEIAASFDALLGSVGHGPPNPDFAITGGWDAIRTVVDVGGGTGGMLAAILRGHPHLRGTLVELPRTVARSAETFQSYGVSDRATAVGQSFFEPLPAGADLYLLRGVLNNWPDAEASTILSRCSEAAHPDGRVVVLKSIDPDGTPPSGIEIDILLTGGKRRSLSDFRTLAARSGLEIIAAASQPSGYYVVECRTTGP